MMCKTESWGELYQTDIESTMIKTYLVTVSKHKYNIA